MRLSVFVAMPERVADQVAAVFMVISAIALILAMIPYSVYRSVAKLRMRRSWSEPSTFKPQILLMRRYLGAAAIVALLVVIGVWLGTGNFPLSQI
jgi:hypothetical protein